MSTSFRRFPSLLIPFLVAIACWTLPGRPAHAGLGQWTPLGLGAGYRRAECVTVHPASPGAVWACMPQGGLYRSADRGATWRWTGGPFTGPWSGVSALTVDPSRPNALWAATSAAVYRTENGGLRWVQLTGASYTALRDTEPFSIASVAGTLYVAASKRLLASPDNGLTWETLYEVDENAWIEAFAISPVPPRNLFIAGHAPGAPFFLRSSNGGATWEDLTNRFPPYWGEISRLVTTPTALFASTGDDHFFRSNNRGESWLDLLAGPSAPARVRAWTFDPRAPRTLYAFGETKDGKSEFVWVSRNEGSTWKKVGKPPIYVERLAVDSARGALYAENSGSLARSLDGGATWKVILRVPDQDSSCAQLSFQPQNPARLDLVAGWTAWRSLDGGRTWALRGLPKGVTDVDVDPEDPARIVWVTSSYALLSENGGATWRRTTGGSDLWYIESLTRVDRQTLLAAGAGLYRSGDNGETWQTVLPGWTRWSDEGRWAQKIEVNPGDPSKVYALTFLANPDGLPHEPFYDYPSILWKSDDGGQTWRKIASNLRAFTFDRGSLHLFGVRNRDLLESTDGGKTWKKVAGTPDSVQDLAVDPVHRGVLYVAAGELLRSADGGATWQPVGGRFGREVYSLTLHPTDPRTLYAADRWGVFELTVPEEP